MNRFMLLAAALAATPHAQAAPSVAERIDADAYVVRDDAGNWADGSMSTTHQVGPAYRAKKILDLGALPEDFWNRVTSVRLSAFFCVRDYSGNKLAKPNGLDETLQLDVNGQRFAVPGNAGLPVYQEGKSMSPAMRWHDFAVPKEALRRGVNEIVLGWAEPAKDKKADDYLYLGIDNSVPTARSQVQLSPQAGWRSDRVNSIGAQGEYMVRLYLLAGRRQFQAVWRPGAGGAEGPPGVIPFAGRLGAANRVEWDVARIDRLDPMSVILETGEAEPFEFRWLDDQGQPLARAAKGRGPRQEYKLQAQVFMPHGIELAAAAPLRSVTLVASRDFHPATPRIDAAPRIAAPRGGPAARPAACRLGRDRITLENANLRCEFAVKDNRLVLGALDNEMAAAPMIRAEPASPLWLVEVGGKRYAGARDFICRLVERDQRGQGFRAVLECPAVALEARLRVGIDDQLHMGLELVNRGKQAVDFKTAFPVLAGLAVSDDPADDYYFYPLGGGIIAGVPALVRQGYGDHQALYQLMDVFSPARGAGLAVWSADAAGRYKVLALRKSLPGRSEVGQDTPRTPTADEFKWSNPLEPVAGTSLAFEYLRRTRGPGQSFVLPEAALAAHAGDWRVPMRDYAAWCHRVWKFRPPSRLADVWTMLAVGWGSSPLFKDGKYRTDFLKPGADCWELMSWWEWSPLGPWSTSFERIREVLSEAAYNRWKGYFVTDPVSGKTMWNNQPGDYDGYNQRFGGLPALRQAIETYKKSGALVTLYTDPIRCDDASKMGQAHGRDWGVVQPDGQHVKSYEVWNMCHDVADYRQWVAGTMARVMRETGADGIRLDEYGHRGWACFNKAHRHTFAEWGNTEWQRAIAETCKLVRRAMDEVAPGSVLTTEHPGYDFCMPYLEGCITYDLTVMASPLRPMECNLQRFLFPECRAYELDHRGADRKLRKRFWNGVASFGAKYPEDMHRVLHENADAFNSRDCEPLVPTRTQHVYANRFGSGAKTLYTLYNATGHTAAGPLLALEPAAGMHVVDLLAQAERPCRGGAVELTLARDDVACLAVLPRRMRLARTGDLLNVQVSAPSPGLVVRLCDAAGASLAERPVDAQGAAALNVKNVSRAGAEPVCLKLLSGPTLTDLIGLQP